MEAGAGEPFCSVAGHKAEAENKDTTPHVLGVYSDIHTGQ